MTASSDQDLTITYTFSFPNGTTKAFTLVMDRKTLELKMDRPDPLPEWTRLEFYHCDNCPLLGTVTHCPVAVNLSAIVESFKDIVSFEHAAISVEVPERSYRKETAVQKGLSSIIGIVMTTSNCPVMDELRPMTRYHLPFATSEETLFRVVSYYLVRQYFLKMSGKTPDWDLKDLVKIYKEVSTVNIGISKRISNASLRDASPNAIVILHSFGDSVSFFVENGLDEIKYLFEKYL